MGHRGPPALHLALAGPGLGQGLGHHPAPGPIGQGHQRVGRRGAALLFFTLLDAVYCVIDDVPSDFEELGDVHVVCSVVDVPSLTRVPAGSWPQRATSEIRCSTSGPSSAWAPNCCHSDDIAFGITGWYSTAIARRQSAIV